MLIAGNLTERIDILTPQVTRGTFNEQKVEYVKAVTVWAGVAYQKGVMALSAGEVWMSRTVSVTMRNNNIINDRCRLVWDDKTYRIESFNRSKKDGSISITATVLDETNQTE